MSEREEQAERGACAELAELFPFYLNGSLDAAEAGRVKEHLATCSTCRQEEHDARTAWALFEGHLPVELLLDYALAQPMSSTARTMVESHLAVCERCVDEVATVRLQDGSSVESSSGAPSASGAAVVEPVFDQERRSDAPARLPRGSARRHRGRSRILAWAASFVAVVASAGWAWTWLQLTDERASTRTVRANLPVVELLPATQSLLRQGSADPLASANRMELPTDPGELALVLLSGGQSCEPTCVLEIHETGEAQPKQRVEGLVASPDGHLTLALPGDWLSSDRTLLVVRDPAGEVVAEYLVEIQPSEH